MSHLPNISPTISEQAQSFIHCACRFLLPCSLGLILRFLLSQIFEQAQSVQKDVACSIVDLNKAHKAYSEDEHVAHEARAKAVEADHK